MILKWLFDRIVAFIGLAVFLVANIADSGNSRQG